MEVLPTQLEAAGGIPATRRTIFHRREWTDGRGGGGSGARTGRGRGRGGVGQGQVRAAGGEGWRGPWVTDTPPQVRSVWCGFFFSVVGRPHYASVHAKPGAEEQYKNSHRCRLAAAELLPWAIRPARSRIIYDHTHIHTPYPSIHQCRVSQLELQHGSRPLTVPCCSSGSWHCRRNPLHIHEHR